MINTMLPSSNKIMMKTNEEKSIIQDKTNLRSKQQDRAAFSASLAYSVSKALQTVYKL